MLKTDLVRWETLQCLSCATKTPTCHVASLQPPGHGVNRKLCSAGFLGSVAPHRASIGWLKRKFPVESLPIKQFMKSQCDDTVLSYDALCRFDLLIWYTVYNSIVCNYVCTMIFSMKFFKIELHWSPSNFHVSLKSHEGVSPLRSSWSLARLGRSFHRPRGLRASAGGRSLVRHLSCKILKIWLFHQVDNHTIII